MSLWLIRTTQNQISGPFPPEVVRTLIQEGKLEPDDEVCPENSYWFFLHESAEVMQHFGVRAPVAKFVASGEATDTQLEVTSERTDPDLNPGSLASSHPGHSGNSGNFASDPGSQTQDITTVGSLMVRGPGSVPVSSNARPQFGNQNDLSQGYSGHPDQGGYTDHRTPGGPAASQDPYGDQYNDQHHYNNALPGTEKASLLKAFVLILLAVAVALAVAVLEETRF